jgi:aromatic ring-opening dioxygenase LigB subunit
MSLNFAAICPHPPLLIPQIGGSDFSRVSDTVLGMRKLANIFRDEEIETLIIISPHSLVYPDRFNVCGMEKLFGTFASFGAPEIIMEFKNDLELASRIDQKANEEKLNTILYDNDGEFFELDHGIMVPLYYLNGQIESPLKLIPIAYSNLSRADHFSFGQVIGEVVKKLPSRVGIIASGDLSHRLIQGAPAGYSEAGKDFDKKIVHDLKNKNVKDILYYEDDLIDNAGECGYRSILILLGVLDSFKNKPEVLSYEGPFGVGYLITNYNLSD